MKIMKYFYSHLVEIESVAVKLDELDLTQEQRIHLADLVDSTIHQTVLEMILSKLSDQDKKAFLSRLQEDPKDEELMKFVNSKVEGIEDEIKKTVNKLKDELHEDIGEAKKQ